MQKSLREDDFSLMSTSFDNIEEPLGLDPLQLTQHQEWSNTTVLDQYNWSSLWNLTGTLPQISQPTQTLPPLDVTRLMTMASASSSQPTPTLPPLDVTWLMSMASASSSQPIPTSPTQFMTTAHNNVDYCVTVNAAQPREKLNIDAFHADREVSTGEAIAYYIKTGKPINVSDEREVREAVHQLVQLKKTMKDTAQTLLVKDILMNSKGIKLPDGTAVPSRKLDDLCDIWAQNSHLAEEMWYLLIKRYEKMKGWELKLEEQVMDSLNLEYVEDPLTAKTLVANSKDKDGNITKTVIRKKTSKRGAKGCIAKMMRLVKRDIIKQFNRAAKETHGLKMTSVNPDVEEDEEGNKKYAKKNIKSSEFSHDLHIKRAKVSTY